MDLLMFTHKSHLARADKALAERGFGRAHHRVLYFVSRKPGETVTGLLEILGIAKQSLARVMRDLTDQGMIEARAGVKDRRLKHLFLTEEGARLEHELFDELHQNMARACSAAGEQAVRGYWTLMQHLMDPATHSQFVAFNGAAPAEKE